MKAALYVVAAVLVVALIAWGLWSFDPFGRRKHAEVRAEVATQQSQIASAETHAVERVIRSEIVLQQQAMEAQDAVREVQGSDTPLPAGFGSTVRDRVERMREPTREGDAERASDAAGDVR